jgi:MFS family permease
MLCCTRTFRKVTVLGIVLSIA